MPNTLSGGTYNNIMEELLRSAFGSLMPGLNINGDMGALTGNRSIAGDYVSGVSGYKEQLEAERKNGSKVLNDQRVAGLKEIDKSTRSAMENINNSLATSGLSYSGAGANTVNRLYENEMDAKNSLLTQIASLDERSRKETLDTLLGLEAHKASLGASDRESERQLLSLLSGMKLSGDRNRMLQDELNLKKLAYDESKTGIGGVLGSILGSLLGISTGGLALGAGDELNNLIFGK
jgi:hypothetical protein